MDAYDTDSDTYDQYASQPVGEPSHGRIFGGRGQLGLISARGQSSSRMPLFAGPSQQTAQRQHAFRPPSQSSRAPGGYRDLGSRGFVQPFAPFEPEEDDLDQNSDPLPATWRPHDSPTNVPTASRQIGRTRLRPTSDLPDAFRRCYRFAAFNAVQSECFDTIFSTDENVVVGAPTGSGKTVLFELAIFRALHHDDESRIVYMAPTKSLCHERAEDWKTRFKPLGIACTELTGDTSGTSTMAELKRSHIVVTTPEKWDSVTRRWRDNEKLLSNLRLFWRARSVKFH